ncbi:hypothetical protein AB0K59_35680 [Streptomyces scopuliridis]
MCGLPRSASAVRMASCSASSSGPLSRSTAVRRSTLGVTCGVG